jgi:Inositol monophosphatase family
MIFPGCKKAGCGLLIRSMARANFVARIPEFCISVAMVDNGRPVAGGVCNPATNEFFLGCI